MARVMTWRSSAWARWLDQYQIQGFPPEEVSVRPARAERREQPRRDDFRPPACGGCWRRGTRRYGRRCREPVANLSVAEVLAEQPQHVSFTASQLKRRRRGWLRRQHMLTLR